MARAVRKKELRLEERLEAALVRSEEQPYEVPGNWCWVRLGALCSFIGGGTPSKDNKEYWNGSIPWASVKDIKGDYLLETVDHITEAGLQNSSASMCEENDLLLVTRIEPAKTIISRIKTSINQDLKIVKSELSSIFLHYYFETFKHEFERKSSGSTVKGITLKIVQNEPLPLPPLQEQERIVNIIESLFADLDEAKEKLSAVLEGFTQRKAVILHQAFTGELTEKWREENGESFESWETVRLQEVCEKITCGKTPKEFISEAGEIPFLKVYNIVNNEIDFEKSQYIPKEIHDSKLKSSILKPNDVVMNIVGPPLRKIAIVPDTYDEWNMNQAIVRFRSKERLDYRYLYYALLNPQTLDAIIQETRGVVGQANISISQARNLEIPLPLMNEQREIVRILDQLFEDEQQAKASVEAVLEDIDTIKKSILARAFRGELGTNEPGEENAREMLKRVL